METCEFERDSNSEDRISQLSDDILVEILSLLELKEAGRSSVLSSRWKDLWKYSTQLKFDDMFTLDKVEDAWWEEEKILGYEISEYVRWVNQVLRRHEGTNVKEFIIEFILDASYSKDIDEWIKFIVAKRVSVLKIRLCSYHTDDYYCFPDQCFQDLKNQSSIDFLTSLSLSYVNITDEHLVYISNLPHLEKLSVSSSKHLFNLKVIGSDVQLKHLKISGCHLKSIQLCAPKLVRFHYFGGKVNDIHIGNNPFLAELILRGSYNDPVVYALVPLSDLLPQLETLQFSMYLTKNMKIPRVVKLELRNLKLLKMHIQGKHDQSLTGLTNKLLSAAPCLKKIILRLYWYLPTMHRLPPCEPLIQPQECLKEVEIFGFVGGRSDFELIAYLWKNALNLEKMVIKPPYPFIWNVADLKETREQLQELCKSAPPGLALDIS